ncbi:heat shock 70 kDa protein 12A-like [Mytilus edulis]|uniref:heat shock 70 kDa protein 12A-like n=1 Tax=Mytilus edulis TaxID=6550 RepID=UPI0039EE727B
MSKAFPNVNIIIPDDADMVVAKGAVLFGHGPNFIVSRIAQYTYGRLIQPLFEAGKHDDSKYVNIDGNERCNKVFDILIKKGEKVEVGKNIRREYETLEERQSTIKIEVFITKEDTVFYTDDEGCKLLCEASVELPTTSTRGKRCIAVDFEFGNTEFKVTAFEKETNKLCEVTCALR